MLRQQALRRTGFTLLELMVVVAIIGILSVVGLSIFKKQSMRANRSEAIQSLDAIHTAQAIYYTMHQQYGDTFDEIGFALDGARVLDPNTIEGPYYTYTMRALPFDGQPRGNFQAIATGDLDPGDDILDILMIENHLIVEP
jgi:prepilin-type N-terminal cleavage/methylation domain-containing protein